MSGSSSPVAEAHAARGSHPADVEQLVRGHVHAVWRYLRMHGASPHEADDLAQEAFLVALRKGAAALDPAATATFLRRTARFLFLHLRRDRHDAVELADAVDAAWERDAARDGGDELLAAMRACVAKLPERMRHAVELTYGIGADGPGSREDVGRALGLQPNGVKTLLQRAREALRTCIQRRPR